MKKSKPIVRADLKAIWVAEKMHKKVKVLSVQKNVPMTTIAEEAIELWIATNKSKS